MDENSVNFNQAVPAATDVVAKVSTKKTYGKTKEFLFGLFFGLTGSVALALLDLLFVAMANTDLGVLILVLAVFGPLLISGLYIYFLIHYFRARRFIFYGLLASLIVFIALFIAVILLP